MRPVENSERELEALYPPLERYGHLRGLQSAHKEV